ncbi:hypothetical protein RvY_15672 [Ramazzottius varieornatus]|uniref:Uncharacterized protein n=1 Tax=Ramazzottius varieornatus TaxID=947166 RepID=A0A1D1VXA8_RAMVA|nr:hypothetical protein RvY_15672 [Ramazzottius varieornatus]
MYLGLSSLLGDTLFSQDWTAFGVKIQARPKLSSFSAPTVGGCLVQRYCRRTLQVGIPCRKFVTDASSGFSHPRTFFCRCARCCRSLRSVNRMSITKDESF